MSNQTYYLTYADRSTDQKTIEGKDLNDLFNRLQISDRVSLLSEGVLPVFHHTSDRQSSIFMDFAYGKYARTRGLRMPVYGVKGKEWKLFRPTHFSQIFFGQEDDLFGPGYIEQVFGRQYLNESECVDLSRSALEERASAAGQAVRQTIVPENIPFMAAVVERIWKFLEEDAKTRIVFLLDHPQPDNEQLPRDMISELAGMIRERDKDKGKTDEQILEEAALTVRKCVSDHILQEQSIMLLQQIYLLLPHRLRLQNGFMSCVTGEDLTKIISKGWPIHITTADREDVAQNALREGVVYIDPTNLRTEDADPQRIALLTKLAENMNESLGTCLSYAEKAVLAEKETEISSFKYFGEIIEKTFDRNLYWWSSDQLDTVEDLYARYQDQTVLMQDPQLSKEAFHEFFTKKLPLSGYPSQLIKMLRDNDYPEREKYLEFFGHEMFGASSLDAAGALLHDLETEKAHALEESAEAAALHEADAVETLRQDLTDSYEAKLQEERTLHNARVKELEQACMDADSRITSLSADLQGERDTIAGLKSQIASKEEIAERIGSHNVELTQRIGELERRLEETGGIDKEVMAADYERTISQERSLREESEGLLEDARRALADQQSAASKNEESLKAGIRQTVEQEKKKASRNLGLALAGFLLAAAGIGFSAYGMMNIGRLKAQNAQLETDVEEAKEQIAGKEGTIQELTADNSNLQKQVDELTAQAESDAARILELEAQTEQKQPESEEPAKETPDQEEQSETETETPASLIVINENGLPEVTYNGDVMPLG